MSRHRFVRNLDYDDYMDDDDYDSYSDDDNNTPSSNVPQATYTPTFIAPQIKKSKQPIQQKSQPKQQDYKSKVFEVKELKQTTRTADLPTKQLSVLSIKSEIKLEPKAEQFVIQETSIVPLSVDAPIQQSKSKVKLNDEEAISLLSTSKPNINVVVIGHVDSGKSTLMGHLLHLLNVTDERQIRKQSKLAQESGKKSFAFAWTMDATDEERERGITMDIGIASFETKNRQFTLLDAPGHKDFVPNMISGTAQADIGILVVDAVKGAFESGFLAGGQTKEHVLLAKSLGVDELFVVVNKCDAMNWEHQRYTEIVDLMTPFLQQVGFLNSVFIPISGLDGLNITVPHKLSWYSGLCLVDALDKMPLPKRPIQQLFRMGLHDIQGTSVSGTISRGFVQPNQTILLLPLNINVKVAKIYNNENIVELAGAGDSVMITLDIDPQLLFSDCVLCHLKDPIPMANVLVVQLVILEIAQPIVPGFQCIYYQRSIQMSCTITSLESVHDKSTGEVIKKKPRRLLKQQVARITMKLERMTCVDIFQKDKQFGRFLLRKSGETIACGIILELK